VAEAQEAAVAEVYSEEAEVVAGGVDDSSQVATLYETGSEDRRTKGRVQRRPRYRRLPRAV
jgi:hypothetical protein